MLEAGADANVKSDDGKTALDFAKENESVMNTDAYQKLVEASSESGRIVPELPTTDNPPPRSLVEAG